MRLDAVLRISAMRNRIRREVSQSVIACKVSRLQFDNRRIPREVSQTAPVCKESLTKFSKMRLAAVQRNFCHAQPYSPTGVAKCNRL